ncbi:hypothetical protein GWI33_019292 [Rhynchophorus ferrugineus]|uniref:Uncharacterized protein n=1 Tax=Rhynchophorus ferrugineus TaxID=354439 RepID=A0A834HWC7_RHYFE|nr:hypothetical protein GWI33_019292 [Rhynchophorus ferrugineus]
MDKREFRVLIKYCILKGKNTVETKTWLDAEFPDTVPGKSTIKNCERPKEVVTDENILRIHKMILNERKL